jgi:hypothetical protein
MKQLYRIAQALLSIARLIGAALYATFALLFMWLALWFFLPSGHGEPVFSLTIFFGLWAAMIGVKALEMFLSTRPRPFPRHRDPRRAARVPAASDRDRFEVPTVRQALW